ncbi:DUF3426 domain-containing protein [Balneatrix alpica]|uniref:DUF3426 domain-containing protein n=1 Tax=Balneatrix alpica TaxID=75684 RepID=A0ABV5ZE99_9GAMM|nr:DUF3426 domain-containing protein [Balneatrix alpica]
MNPVIARCPHCQTQFRVTQTQLQQAAGRVRCGVCMQVFHAQPATGLASSAANTPRSFAKERLALDPLPKPLAPLEVLGQLSAEPPLLPQRKKKSKGRWLNGLLLLAIPLQALWWWRQELAWQAPLAPAFEWACQYLPCGLQARSNLAAIRSQHLYIRDHPDYEKMLLVSTLIENQADFAQPFPVLGLTFYDLQGRPSAQRYLRPQDYLQGELVNLELMPAHTPIQLELGLEDPGLPSISYTLQFYPTNSDIPSLTAPIERVE